LAELNQIIVSGQKTESEIKPINIRELFRSKSPRLARMIPGFVYRFINKIMHIDFVNEFLRERGHLKEIEFVNASLKHFEISEKRVGYENIPASGRFIFAANHPLGGFDSMLLMKAVHEKLGRLKFLVNDVLMTVPNFGDLFVPVNKHGSYARDAARLLHEAYSSGIQILIFPSGFASRKIKGKVADLEWKKHFISKAIEYKRDIIPVFISGENSKRFYRVANLRKLFRIKWNLEMFLLPDETYRHRKKELTLYFGNPIPFGSLDKSRTHQGWADYVKNLVYSLPVPASIENKG